MKKVIKCIAFFSLAVSLSALSLSCKKDAARPPVVSNTAVIKLDNAQPAVDSVITFVQNNNSSVNSMGIAVYLNHNASPFVYVSLSFSPSDPLYAAGATINLATSPSATVEYMGSNGFDDYVDYFGYGSAEGIVTITKNDAAARRIEGTLTGCVATNSANAKITINGSFAVAY